MPQTRTSTGTISRLQYDLATLQFQGERRSTRQPSVGTTSKPGSPLPRSPTTKRTRKSSIASIPRSPISKLFSGHHFSASVSQKDGAKDKNPDSRETGGRNACFESPPAPASLHIPMPAIPDICEGINFFPARAWGELEEVGLSAIGRAERDIEIWEDVKQSHAEGGLENMVPAIEAVLEGAKEELEKLKAEERAGATDLGRVGAENPSQVAIQARLQTLEWALSTSKFQPERDNITGAIRAYESGDIGYNTHYTILYAGNVVDKAPNYGAMVLDRQERLDRYYALHGPHWIWYEPPLNIAPEARPTMLGSVALHRVDAFTNLGAWYITQGFWKRSGWVHRMSATMQSSAAVMDPFFKRQEDGKVFCQDNGPKQAFRSFLDSGATYPSLYKSDFQKLMIDENNYAAQTVQQMDTANGPMNSRMFELFVSVLDDRQRNLVDEKHCAHPYYAKYLGGLCPVAEVHGQLGYDMNGKEVSMRLSGLLPFVACYMSVTPTRNALYLGEDRKDVLGSHRMPGSRKWDIALPAAPPRDMRQVQHTYGDPKTTFHHRDGAIIDQDDVNKDFASDITFYHGTPQQFTVRNCPAEAIEAMRAKKEAERRAAAEAELLRVTANLTNEIRNRPQVVAEIQRRLEADRLREAEQLASGGGGFAPAPPNPGGNPMPGQGSPAGH